MAIRERGIKSSHGDDVEGQEPEIPLSAVSASEAAEPASAYKRMA